MKIADSITDLTGNTPLVCIKGLPHKSLQKRCGRHYSSLNARKQGETDKNDHSILRRALSEYGTVCPAQRFKGRMFGVGRVRARPEFGRQNP
jgi:hypothetical protein